jgi:hypothetical protein
MEQQWAHQQRSANTYSAHLLRCLLTHRRDILFGYPAVQVGAWDDAQGTILLTTVVEVEPHGDHVLQHLGQRLNVNHVGLHRPWPEPLGLDTLLHGNGHVLVPGNLPIRVRNLVEEDASDRKELLTENRLNQLSDCLRVGQFPHLQRYVQKVADGEDATPLAHRSGVADVLQRGEEMFYRCAGQDTSDDGKTFCLDCPPELSCNDHALILESRSMSGESFDSTRRTATDPASGTRIGIPRTQF